MTFVCIQICIISYSVVSYVLYCNSLCYLDGLNSSFLPALKRENWKQLLWTKNWRKISSDWILVFYMKLEWMICGKLFKKENFKHSELETLYKFLFKSQASIWGWLEKSDIFFVLLRWIASILSCFCFDRKAIISKLS